MLLIVNLMDFILCVFDLSFWMLCSHQKSRVFLTLCYLDSLPGSRLIDCDGVFLAVRSLFVKR